MQAKGWITQRPPRVMYCVPWSWERRETLLPLSVSTQSGFEEEEEEDEVEDVLVVVVGGGGGGGGMVRWVGGFSLWGAFF